MPLRWLADNIVQVREKLLADVIDQKKRNADVIDKKKETKTIYFT